MYASIIEILKKGYDEQKKKKNQKLTCRDHKLLTFSGPWSPLKNKI